MISKILYYRFLDDVRVLYIENPNRVKSLTCLLMQLLIIPGMFLLMFPIFNRFLLEFSNTGSMQTIPPALQWVTILLTLLQFFYFLTEFFRSFATCREFDLFLVSPISPSATLIYLTSRSSLKGIANLLVFSSFTPLLLWKLNRSIGAILFSISLELIFILTLIYISLSLFILGIEPIVRFRISMKTLAVLCNIPLLISTFIALAYLIPEMGGHLAFGFSSNDFLNRIIRQVSVSFHLITEDSSGYYWAITKTLVWFTLSFLILTRITLPRWNHIANRIVLNKEEKDIKVQGRSRFSDFPVLSVFQKDLKQLFRDSATKSSIATIGITLVVITFLRCMVKTSGPQVISPNQMATSALIFLLFPLFLSARTMVYEIAFLEIYRLTTINISKLIQYKLSSHIVLNLLIAFLFYFVNIFMGRAHASTLDILFFFMAVLIFTPLMTCLALALGILFPELTGVKSLFALQMKGLAFYGFVYLFTYAFAFYSHELIFKGQNQQAWISFLIGVVLSLSGPVTLLIARNRLIRSIP